ncbi:hypothetical protein IQ07DRAFT_642197 [Pyrenochaeta sp. DS3sAY3a]|nr:hypothetical protein IQ07DRAFT_642197 [Pyrenochaeta sp. DS3sAY3a]
MFCTVTKLLCGLSCFDKKSKDEAADEAPKKSSKASRAESRSSALPPQMITLPPSPVRARLIPRSAGNGRRPSSEYSDDDPFEDEYHDFYRRPGRDLNRYAPARNLTRAPHELTPAWTSRTWRITCRVSGIMATCRLPHGYQLSAASWYQSVGCFMTTRCEMPAVDRFKLILNRVREANLTLRVLVALPGQHPSGWLSRAVV